MRQSLLIFLSVFLLTATANTAQAFDEKDLAKLNQTKKCVKCDLTGAKLRSANLLYANLTEADLTNAKHSEANMNSANLAKTKIQQAKIQNQV